MSTNKGFTLIELLVAMTLGSIITAGLLGAFVAFLQHQTLGQEERSALETIRFSIDSISRDLYFGRDYTCADEDTSNASTEIDVCKCITFIDQLERQIKVRAKDGIIERASKRIGTDKNTCVAGSGWVPLSGRSAQILSLAFTLRKDINTQPQVGIEISAEYNVGSEKKKIKVRTQVTRRILEASQSIANTFRVGDYQESFGLNYYTVYDSSGNCTDEGAENTYTDSDFNPCDIDLQPVLTEFTSKGLFILLDNGLIAFIKKTDIDNAIENGDASGIEESVQIVKKGTDADAIFDDNTPRDIIEIYSAGASLFAKSRTGALYKITFSGDVINPKRLLSGGSFTRESLRLFSSYDDKSLLLYKDDDGTTQFQYYDGLPDSLGFTCPAIFSNSSSNRRGCNEIQGTLKSGTSTNEDSVMPSELSQIPIIFIKKIQITPNSLFHIWYSEESEEKYFGVFNNNVHRENYGTNNVPSEYDFTYNTDSRDNDLYAICEGGNRICKYVFSETESKRTHPLPGVKNGDKLVDSAYLDDKIFAIVNDGKLNMVSKDIKNKDFIEINNLKGVKDDENILRNEILCGVLPKNPGTSDENPFGNVLFQHLSQKHPDQDIISSVVSVASSSSGNTIANELLFLVNANIITNKGGVTDDHINRCENEIFERYTAQSTETTEEIIDIIRFSGLKFRTSRKP